MTISKLSIVVLVAAGGCASQVDGTHQGQVLASLEGTMQTAQSGSPITVDVSVVWVIGSGGTSFVGADKVQVTGSLPSNFSLSIFNPPLDAVMSVWDGVKFGAALVTVEPTGVDPHEWQMWRGVENDHLLIYLPVTPPAGSAVAGLLHGTPTAGFHLYDVRRLTEAERQQRLACITQASGGLGHMITRSEILAACGGDGHDELSLAAKDLDTQLSIQIIGQFGLDQFNALPSWMGL